MIKFYIISPPKEMPYLYLKDEDGTTYFQSRGHSGKKGVKRGLEIIRENAKLETQYQSYDGYNRNDLTIREYFWVLKAGNGAHYGGSPRFATPQERDANLAIFKANVFVAEVVDLAPEVTW